MKKYEGSSKLALLPTNTQQISEILKYCNSHKLAVCPQSGNTGLVGGGVPVKDEIVISLKKMDKIEKFDTNTDILTCEAGCVLENLGRYLGDFNCDVPIDLGSRGSCLIGGNLATNAGGKYFIKYGSLRKYVIGLEAVLPTGKILNMLNELRKDNTGFDLKQLFIGSEGLLGIITKINLLCIKKEKYKTLLCFSCETFDQVLKLNSLAKNHLTINLAAIEYLDSYAYEVVLNQMSNIQPPFPSTPPFTVLIEIVGNENMDNLISDFYSITQNSNSFKDCLISSSEQQYNNLWQHRERVGESCIKLGLVYKYDVSVDPSYMNELVVTIRNITKNLGVTVGYGHIGDGNVHVNVAAFKGKEQEIQKILEPFIWNLLKEKKGSISAEHGMGKMKAGYLNYAKKEEVVDEMRKIKELWDPNGILNPGKVLG